MLLDKTMTELGGTFRTGSAGSGYIGLGVPWDIHSWYWNPWETDIEDGVYVDEDSHEPRADFFGDAFRATQVDHFDEDQMMDKLLAEEEVDEDESGFHVSHDLFDALTGLTEEEPIVHTYIDMFDDPRILMEDGSTVSALPQS